MFLWGFVARHLRRWHAYNRTVNELSKLDDHMLADINLTRGDIRSVARRAVTQY